MNTSTFKMIIPVLAALVFAGSAGAKKQEQEIIPAKRPVSEFVKDDRVYLIKAYDPWEGWNRRVYYFNYGFDKYVFLPVVKGYQFIAPKPVEKGVSNFFSNIGEVNTFANCALQAKGKKMGITASRFCINSTIGILGLFDVASKMGLEKEDEDFGQTLGAWGVGTGRYLVLPVMGPSNVRDTTGIVVDGVGHYLLMEGLADLTGLNDDDQDTLKTGLSVLRAIDTRANVGFRYYRTGSPFEYELVRMLYKDMREIKVEN